VEADTDLARMLSGLTVTRRPGTFTFVVIDASDDLAPLAHATVRESEGLTAVVCVDDARAHGRPVGFEAVWLTLDVHSALEAVGLTAAVSTALTEAGIACNVLAGHHHDHLLVPASRADEAIQALTRLREAS
jgi:uncharacterized protein